MNVIFEFRGGSRDGQTCEGQSDGGPTDEAATDFLLTHEGSIGKRFWTTTSYAWDQLQTRPREYLVDASDIRAEIYEVTDKVEAPETGEVYVRCTFSGHPT